MTPVSYLYRRTMKANRSAPPAPVTPVLVYPDVQTAVAWLIAALGAQEKVRIGDGHRSQLEIAPGGAVVVAEPGNGRVPPAAGGHSHLLKVRTPDVDAAFVRACGEGARVIESPTTFGYGERSCVVEDPAGHRWELTQTVEDVEPESWGGVTVSPW